MERGGMASTLPRRAKWGVVLPWLAVVAMFGVGALTKCTAAEPVPAYESLRMMSR
jgi:hypothetical protein